MKIFGLTGGIASGKSTVSKLFAQRGVKIIDADLLAREVIAPGTPGLRQVAERFPTAMNPDGSLDRAALGERVFASWADREALNQIVHPLVRAEFQARVSALAAAGLPFALYDVALLFENRLDRELDGVVLVTAPIEVQRSRLMARNGLTEAQAQARIDAQLPLEAKKPFARWLIDNGGTLEATNAQVEHVWQQLRAEAARG